LFARDFRPAARHLRSAWPFAPIKQIRDCLRAINPQGVIRITPMDDLVALRADRADHGPDRPVTNSKFLIPNS